MYIHSYIHIIRERFISGDVQDERAKNVEVAVNSESPMYARASFNGNVVPYKVYRRR